LITGAAQMDGAILVFQLLTAQCRKQRASCYPRQVAFLISSCSEQSMVDDAELIELVEMEIELLDMYEFPGDDTIIVGSALKSIGRATPAKLVFHLLLNY
jgi:translation elongation factor EF-Tu-like GTPase